MPIPAPQCRGGCLSVCIYTKANPWDIQDNYKHITDFFESIENYHTKFVLAMKNWIITGGIAIALLYALSKKKASDNIRWQVQGFDLQKLSLNVLLINPTYTPIQLSSWVAEIFINGKSAGIMDYRNAVTITGNGSKVISIPIRFNPLAAITILPLLRDKKALKNAKINMQGNIAAEGLSIPFNQDINLV